MLENTTSRLDVPETNHDASNELVVLEKMQASLRAAIIPIERNVKVVLPPKNMSITIVGVRTIKEAGHDPGLAYPGEHNGQAKNLRAFNRC